MGQSQERARALVQAEMDRQDLMWGEVNERADIAERQLMRAGMAQLVALDYRQRGYPCPFAAIGVAARHFYPPDWSGFRDYGSDIANLVVAAAFIQQEIARKLRAGEDTTRLSRDAAAQPYLADQPKLIEP